MRDGYPIIDADRHVVEPIAMWRDYLEPEFRDHAPYAASMGDGPLAERIARLGTKALLPLPPMPMVDGKPFYNKMPERAWAELAWAARSRAPLSGPLDDPQTQLDAMDREGVDMAFLYPTYALLLLGVDTLDPALAAAFARAYNRWLRDHCSRDPQRLRGLGLIATHHPEEMVDEVGRVATHGFRGVVLRPNPVAGRTLADPAYEAFWTECERRSLAVVIHEGTHAHLPAAGADRFETRFALHACSHPMEQMMAILALIEGGVLERHPALQFAFLEAGCGWLPYWLHRLDDEYAHLRGEVAASVRMPPSAYFRRQCFIAFEPNEPLLAEVAAHVGADRLLFGTDFPHLDHDEGLVDAALALNGKLPESALRKMLWENAARLFGLEG